MFNLNPGLINPWFTNLPGTIYQMKYHFLGNPHITKLGDYSSVANKSTSIPPKYGYGTPNPWFFPIDHSAFWMVLGVNPN
jgi:aromatic ring-opening dioxygenase catalytic subunit (LigB family)